MIVCVHQPNFLPWLGFFAKVAQSDVYVVMDNVQFPKNCLTNRVRIAGNGEPLWLTVPIRRGPLKTLIADIEIDYSRDWVKQQRATLEARYSRSSFFKFVYSELVSVLETRPARLLELNMLLIRWVLDMCGVRTRVVLGTKLNAAGKASELIVAQCLAVGATTYVAGKGSADYDDSEVYETAGIQYRRQQFHHPEYPQYGRSQFLPGLSILDSLFNVGVQGVGLMLAEHTSTRLALKAETEWA
jgi:hypothetical protein